MERLARTVRLILIVTGPVLLASCGGSGPKLHPVTGKVLFDGKPVEGATVVLQPTAGGELKPSGATKADGSFALNTYPHGEGAPAGEYVVLITWLPPNARELENPKNKLPARYSDIKAGLLKATVKDGPTELEPFKLTK